MNTRLFAPHACPYCGWGARRVSVSLAGMNTHIGKKHPGMPLLNQEWRPK